MGVRAQVKTIHDAPGWTWQGFNILAHVRFLSETQNSQKPTSCHRQCQAPTDRNCVPDATSTTPTMLRCVHKKSHNLVLPGPEVPTQNVPRNCVQILVGSVSFPMTCGASTALPEPVHHVTSVQVTTIGTVLLSIERLGEHKSETARACIARKRCGYNNNPQTQRCGWVVSIWFLFTTKTRMNTRPAVTFLRTYSYRVCSTFLRVSLASGTTKAISNHFKSMETFLTRIPANPTFYQCGSHFHLISSTMPHFQQEHEQVEYSRSPQIFFPTQATFVQGLELEHGRMRDFPHMHFWKTKSFLRGDWLNTEISVAEPTYTAMASKTSLWANRIFAHSSICRVPVKSEQAKHW